MSQRPLVLASSSPYRRALLERLMVDFECISPDIDESQAPNESPIELVRRLAVEKAQAIAKQRPTALIIGSDQVAVHNGQIVGKPHTPVKLHGTVTGKLQGLAGLGLGHTAGDLRLLIQGTRAYESRRVIDKGARLVHFHQHFHHGVL